MSCLSPQIVNCEIRLVTSNGNEAYFIDSLCGYEEYSHVTIKTKCGQKFAIHWNKYKEDYPLWDNFLEWIQDTVNSCTENQTEQSKICATNHIQLFGGSDSMTIDFENRIGTFWTKAMIKDLLAINPDVQYSDLSDVENTLVLESIQVTQENKNNNVNAYLGSTRLPRLVNATKSSVLHNGEWVTLSAGGEVHNSLAEQFAGVFVDQYSAVKLSLSYCKPE